MRSLIAFLALATTIAPAIADRLPKPGMYCPPYGQGFPIVFEANGRAGIDSLDCEKVSYSGGRIRSPKCMANGGSRVTLNEPMTVRQNGSVHYGDVAYTYIGQGKTVLDCPGTPAIGKRATVAPEKSKPTAEASSAPPLPAPKTPEDAMRQVITFDRRGGANELFNTQVRTPTMRRLLSESLALNWLAAWAAGEKENIHFFDANVFTAKQNLVNTSKYSNIKVIKTNGRTADVEATVYISADDGGFLRQQVFTFVREGDGWRLDEIDYTPGAEKPHNLHGGTRMFVKSVSKRVATR